MSDLSNCRATRTAMDSAEGVAGPPFSASSRKPRSPPTSVTAESTMRRSNGCNSVSLARARVIFAKTLRLSRWRFLAPASVAIPIPASMPEELAEASGASSPFTRISIPPTAITSPAVSFRRSIFSPLTWVPFEDPRSVTHVSPSPASMRQWCLEAKVLATRMSLSTARPTRTIGRSISRSEWVPSSMTVIFICSIVARCV